MYITQTTAPSTSGQPYICTLLRESYREGDRVKNRTLANLSHAQPEEIAALRLALEHKHNLAELGSIEASLCLQEGLSIGALWTVYTLAKRLGIEKALGSERAGGQAGFMASDGAYPRSRLPAVRRSPGPNPCGLRRLGARAGIR